jgi:hypothetical protein
MVVGVELFSTRRLSPRDSKDMTAVGNASCENLAGVNWASLIWNGNSRIDCCAAFN